MANTLFSAADYELPKVATEGMKREALARELRYRERVYPRLVNEGKMTKRDADYQVWILRRILEDGFRPG